ncbi:MAG TPA: pyruvate dehydrogenase (acetyl-transferring) E1 component subunit alpha [Pantanalinema sp.]
MDKQLALEWYRKMALIRRFEEKCAEGYAYAKIGGFLHLYIGQEAVAVGAISALNDDDDIVTHYRDHGHAIARGLDTNSLMAELYGKATGCSKGRGGSMHFADASKHFWGGYALVGAHLPIAVGLAMASQYRGEDRLAMAIFGDGSTNNGGFHESLNMAAVFKLPVIFLIENNLYSMGVALQRDSAISDLYKRAASYGILGEAFDGMDVEATHEATKRAVAHVRAGNGPVLLEAKTYRFRGHSMADPEMYRSKEEVEFWKQKDPIVTWKARCVEAGIATAAEFDEVEAAANREAEESVKFADESPEPELSTLCDNIYANPIGQTDCQLV